MSRMRVVVGAMIVIAVLLICIWVWFSGAGNSQEKKASADVREGEPVMPATPMASSSERGAKGKILVSPVGDQSIEEADNSEQEESMSSYQQAVSQPPVPLDAALQSMRHSLSQGDSRTPPLREPVELVQPTLEELEDPVLYQQYERRNTMATGNAYLSAAKEIPALRDKIAQARRDGSRTPEEIEEAEQALWQLEKMQMELESALSEVESGGESEINQR